MPKPSDAGEPWVETMVQFLRRQPGVSAVRLDPAAHRIEVATVGQVDFRAFGEADGSHSHGVCNAANGGGRRRNRDDLRLDLICFELGEACRSFGRLRGLRRLGLRGRRAALGLSLKR